MTEPERVCRIELPRAVKVDLPRDRAANCKDGSVAVCESSVGAGELRISWDDSTLSWASNGEQVEFARRAVAGLVVDFDEVFHVDHRLCSLRIGIVKQGRLTGTSLLLFARPADRDAFARVVDSIRDLPLPVEAFATHRELYEHWMSQA